jgi:hypothetical protein
MKLQNSKSKTLTGATHNFSSMLSKHKLVFYALLVVLSADLFVSALLFHLFIKHEALNIREKLADEQKGYQAIYRAWRSEATSDALEMQYSESFRNFINTHAADSPEQLKKALPAHFFHDSLITASILEGSAISHQGVSADTKSAIKIEIRIVCDSNLVRLEHTIPIIIKNRLYYFSYATNFPKLALFNLLSPLSRTNFSSVPRILLNDGSTNTYCSLQLNAAGSVMQSSETQLPQTSYDSDPAVEVQQIEKDIWLEISLHTGSSSAATVGKVLIALLSVLVFVTVLLLGIFYFRFKKEIYNYRNLYLIERDSRDIIENYKLILENQGEGVQIFDAEDNVLFVNKMGEEIFGVPSGKLIGRNIAEFLDTQENKKRITELNRRRMGISSQYEISISSADGKLKTLKVTSTPRFDENGKYIGSFAVFHDTTELRTIELKLSASDAYLRALIESIPQMIWLKDKDLNFIMANQNFVKALGKEHESEIIGRSDFDLVPFERANAYNDVDSSIIRQNTPYTIREEIFENGKMIWQETVKTAVRNSEGELIGLSGITTDITERMQQEKSILRARDFYRRIFENFPVMIWMTDNNGNTSYYNNTYLKFRGTTYDAEIQSGWSRAIRPEEKSRLVGIFRECFRENRVFEAEYEMLAANGEYRWVMDIGQPYNDIDGNFGGYIGVCMDISEQKASAALILESEERYRDLVENISDVVFRISKDGAIIYISHVIYQITGYQPEEIIGRQFRDFVYAEDFPRVNDKFNITLTMPTQSEEFRLVTIANETRWVRSQIHLYYDGDEVGGVQGILTDIENHKKAQEALQESEERFRSIFERAYEGIMLADANRKIIDWNSALEKMTGFSAAEVLMQDICEIQYKLVPPEQRDEFPLETLQKNYDFFFSSNTDQSQYSVRRISLLHKSGALVSADQVSFIIKTGNINLLCSILRDITKETYVEQENLKLNLAVEQSPNIIIITNLRGEIDYTNPAFEELTGYTREEVYGKRTSMLKSGKTSDDTYKDLWETISRGDTWRGEFCNRKKNGEFYWELASIRPVRNKDGEFINYLAIKEDITERKQIEEELVAARNKAEEMNLLKSNFLANMSHELRTPMIGILGYSTMLKDDTHDESIRNIGEVIFKSGNRLLETLNLILDLSRLEAQKVEIQLNEIDICHPIREIMTLFESAASLKNLHLRVKFSTEPIWFATDQKILRHIITNLLNNAVKYTHKGGIDISCTVEDEGSGKALLISVQDTGIGISPEDQEIIFEEFRQVSEGFSRSFEGTGLGLTLTKRFLEKLNGTISVVSELGQGSTFTVRLPDPTTEQRKAEVFEALSTPEEITPTRDESKSPALHILLVENDPINAEVIGYFMNNIYTYEIALSGEEALERSQQKEFDLLLMDINLGQGMSGLDVTRKLRRIEQYKQVPIIAITAFAMKGDREEFLEAGCTDYLAKPFSKADLLGKIRQVCAF